jgi:uncharacterized protein involved in exopolysaccharide biosynthesis
VPNPTLLRALVLVMLEIHVAGATRSSPGLKHMASTYDPPPAAPPRTEPLIPALGPLAPGRTGENGTYGVGDVEAPDGAAGASADWIGLVLRHLGLIITLPAVLAAATVSYGLLKPREYSSFASFTPRAADNLGRGALGGLAAQLGVSVDADPAQSPDFYSDLVTSRPIMSGVAQQRYDLPAGGPLPSGTGIELLRATGPTPGRRLDDAIRRLRNRVVVTKNTKTGLVRVAVTTRSPVLSAQMASRVLELVDRFNQDMRQQKAADEQRFTEQRLRDLRTELSRAEDALAAFTTRNRIRDSPDLALEEQRLSRNVTMRQTVYTNLAQVYEQARLNAARNVPVITIVERPEPAARPDTRGVALKGALAILLGIVAAITLAVSMEALSRTVGERVALHGGWLGMIRAAREAGRDGRR